MFNIPYVSDTFDLIENREPDNAVVVTTENTARINGDSAEIVVTHDEFDDITIGQDGDFVFLQRAEAEALFLVLDTMLHPEEE